MRFHVVRLRVFALCAWLVLFVAGAASAGPAPEKVDPSSFANVANVQPGGRAPATIAEKTDRIWFRITLDKAGYLKPVIDEGKADHLETEAVIYNSQGGRLRAREARVNPGKFFIMVHERQQNEASEHPVTVHFHFQAETDPTEPGNNRRGQARSAPLKRPVLFTLMPLGDVDWFSVDVTKPGVLRAAVDKQQAGHLDLAIELFDADGNKLGRREARVKRGVNYVRIKENEDNESSLDQLKARFELIPDRDVSEPNDAPGEATPVEVEDTFKLAIFPKQDADWFAVDAPEAGYLWLESANRPEETAGLDIGHRFVGETGQRIGDGRMVRVAGPGTVKFVLTERQSNESSPALMTWRVRFTRELDLLEPNDTPRFAAPLKINTWTRAVVAPSNDRDFYRLKIENAGWLVLDTDNVPEGLDLRGRLFDAEGDDILGRGHVIEVEPGEYLYRVDTTDNHTPVKPFDLRFLLWPENDDLETIGDEPARLRPRDLAFDIALYDSTDEDQWRVTLDEPGYLRLRIEPLDDKSRAHLRVKRGKRVAFEGPVTRRHARGLTPIRLQAGTYRITFSDQTRYWPDRPRRYRMHASFKPEHDVHEPNDTVGQATPLTVGQSAMVTVYGGHDLDWFSLDVTKPGYIRLELAETGAFSAFDAIGLELTLIQQVESELKTLKRVDNAAELGMALFRVSKPGSYLLRIRSPQHGFDAKPFALKSEHYADKPPPVARGGMVTALVGIEFEDKTKDVFKQVAAATGAVHLQADDVDQLKAVMHQAVTDAVKVTEAAQTPSQTEVAQTQGSRVSTRRPLYVLVALSGLVAIAAAFWVRRKLRSHKKGSRR